MKAHASMLAAMLLIACSKESVTREIGEVAKEVRNKPRVELLVKTATEQPTAEDQALLRTIEESIEREGIGRVTTSGTQPARIFVIVEADNSADAIDRLRALALKQGILKRSSFRIVPTGS